jgi:hypothetical protein
VDDGRELRGGRAAHALGGAVGCDQLGELRLQARELAVEAVVGLVRDLGLPLDVVEVVVPADLVAQLRGALLGLLGESRGQSYRRDG